MDENKFEAMKEGGKILASILQELKENTIVGMKTIKFDEMAKRLCLKFKVKPSFLNYNGFPAAICVSINNQIVHGLPGERVIEEGDLVSLDFGVLHKGYNTDAAITFGVGEITEVAKKIISVTEKSMYLGIEQAKAGNNVGDIGNAVQKEVEKNGFGVVRILVGHGIGKKVHEEPMIPNFGNKGEGPVIKEGMALAIEPMTTGMHFDLEVDEDNWTYKTKDNSLSCHFEHTVFVTKEGPVILTKL